MYLLIVKKVWIIYELTIHVQICSSSCKCFAHIYSLQMQEIWVQSLDQEDPWSRKCQTTSVFLPANYVDSKTWWATYSPWGHKEPNTTERLSIHSLQNFIVSHHIYFYVNNLKLFYLLSWQEKLLISVLNSSIFLQQNLKCIFSYNLQDYKLSFYHIVLYIYIYVQKRN